MFASQLNCISFITASLISLKLINIYYVTLKWYSFPDWHHYVIHYFCINIGYSFCTQYWIRKLKNVYCDSIMKEWNLLYLFRHTIVTTNNKGSVPTSQEPDTVPYSEPYEIHSLIFLIPILMLSSHLHLDISSYLCGFSTKCLHFSSLPCMLYDHPSHLPWSDLSE